MKHIYLITFCLALAGYSSMLVYCTNLSKQLIQQRKEAQQQYNASYHAELHCVDNNKCRMIAIHN